MSTDEASPGGSKIYRHKEAAPADEVAHADDERITKHLERTIGGPYTVWHELVSDRVHIDVHVVAPTEANPCLTLVTAGMSARPMKLPPDVEPQWGHAELCMFLPHDWKLDEASLDDERHYWPIRLLKTLARLPHEYDTWLGWGHSIPNGNPAKAYAAGTKLSGAVVVPPFALADEFFAVEGEPAMHVFQVLPVTDAEMAFKLKKGLDPLLEKLEKAHPEIYGPLVPGRRSAV